MKNEDQLLNFINDLYLNDVKYSIFYESVLFKNVTSNSMIEFISIFDLNDISNQIWQQISSRLIEEIEKKTKSEITERYKTSNCVKEKSSGKLFTPTNNESFSGIIDYLKKQSNYQIKNEIDFTCSSCCNPNSYQPINVTMFNNKNKYFLSNDSQNSWICFCFKNHRVIPSHYTIRTFGLDSNSHPKSWTIEGSNDKNSWENLDIQNESPYLQKGWVTHTFNINESSSNSYEFIRMRLTGKTTCNDYRLLIDSFEIYGTLI